MTAQRLREWPRLIAAIGVLAIVLVLVGVLVASASAGGTNQSGTINSLRRVNATQSARLTGDARRLATLRASLTAETGRLATARTELATSQSVAQCWQGKARHPKREKGIVCPSP
jgi:type II secretory pathway pseudopilin PulG